MTPSSIRRLTGLAAAALLAALAAVPARAQSTDSEERPKFVYTLSPTDRIRVTVFQEDDLDTTSRIDANGNVNLPLLGDVRVAGYAVEDAEKAIEKAYRDGRILRKPQVTISIEDYALREVSIQGQVKAPGRYILPIESTFSVVELVTKAGGFTDIAKGDEVIVTHIGADGTKSVQRVDVQSIIQGKGPQKSRDQILLQPGDIVYVPERII